MAALSNKDFMKGWIDGYYPYSEYMIEGNNLILSGDKIKVNNEILTKDVIEKSTSGYNNSTTSQSGGNNKVKKYKIKADDVDGAFEKLKGKIKGGKGDILVLKLQSLDDKRKINFYKIYRKKM